MGVDIIIPIYNAYEDLCKCMQSIHLHTDFVQNRLILINDNSTDTRIGSYLDNQASGNIIVIHNKENRGFSNNINLGMQQSAENDVILLNSDTIVTPNWVEKMVKCAYSDISIGTVTPLSNNATLCSVPNFCEENVLPEGMDAEQVALIVEECSLKKYPRITVANGFCMFIKRELINVIGKFDAETFGRGYGEENDFCNRAEQMGFIHVMCDDTYIYHSGTKSFISEEKEKYIREHDCILNKRYPEQMRKNAVYCQENPNGWVGKNIACYLDIWNGKKNVLYLLQADFREGADDNVGGTQLHVKHLTMGLRKDMNIFVAARDRDYLQVTAYTEEKEYIFRFYVGEKELFPQNRNRDLAKIFRAVLMGFKIDLVHVHHTATTSNDIYYEADKLQIPIIFTAHDFYYICPSEKLLDSDGCICIEKKSRDCESCLRKKKNVYEQNNYISMWQKVHREVLGICKCIVTPSKSAKDILSKFYPEYENKIKVIEHGMDTHGVLDINEADIHKSDEIVWQLDKIDTSGRCPVVCGRIYMKGEPEIRRKVILKVTDTDGSTLYVPTNFDVKYDLLDNSNKFIAYIPDRKLNDGRIVVTPIMEKDNQYYWDSRTEAIGDITFAEHDDFRVAFIGGINTEKGGELITEIIKRGGDQIGWYIFGGIGDKNLFNLQKKNLIKTSFYYEEDIETFLELHSIDVVCILSKWPETFSYTLSEAILAKCPVIATDVGALGERMKKNIYGSVVKLEDTRQMANNVINIILGWKRQKNAYERLREDISLYNHRTIRMMDNEYAELYELLYESKMHMAPGVETLEYLNCAYVSGYGYQDENMILKQKCKAMENRIKKIDNNATIRIMLKLTEREFPFKKQLKKMIMKHI